LESCEEAAEACEAGDACNGGGHAFGITGSDNPWCLSFAGVHAEALVGLDSEFCRPVQADFHNNGFDENLSAADVEFFNDFEQRAIVRLVGRNDQRVGGFVCGDTDFSLEGFRCRGGAGGAWAGGGTGPSCLRGGGGGGDGGLGEDLQGLGDFFCGSVFEIIDVDAAFACDGDVDFADEGLNGLQGSGAGDDNNFIGTVIRDELSQRRGCEGFSWGAGRRGRRWGWPIGASWASIGGLGGGGGGVEEFFDFFSDAGGGSVLDLEGADFFTGGAQVQLCEDFFKAGEVGGQVINNEAVGGDGDDVARG